jgi:mannose-6-phosphate isomerase
MWYILESGKDSKIYSGFREAVSRIHILKQLKNGSIAELLNYDISKPGDVFFTPAGRIHAIGEGILLVEYNRHQILPTGYLTGTGKETTKTKRTS